jgi:GTP-binding protein
MNFLKNAVFIKSVYNMKDIIEDKLPMYVMVGKSNVGKSSFINALANQKKLAHVGNTPGKTRCINYYCINKELYLVDLPGYGFSRMSKDEKESINKLTNAFLKFSPDIKHIFFLIDIRHEPTDNDRAMYDWLASMEIPFSIIANKSDKISKGKAEEMKKVIEKKLFSKEDIIPFSSQDKTGVEYILDLISKN